MHLASGAGRLFFLACTMFSSPYCKTVDIVDTKDKSVYKGTITEEDSASVFIELEGGSIIRVPRSDVLKIRRAAADQEKGYHQHDGFFLSMNMGGGSGFVQWDRSNNKGSGTATVSGGGPMMDFKIGGAVQKNLILSFDMLINPIIGGDFSGKGLDVNGLGQSSPDSGGGGSIVAAGLGITYYFMPYNVFVNGTLGRGELMVENKYGLHNDSYGRYSDASGYDLQFKIGKEWWVSKNWGLGISAYYAFFAGDESAGDAADTSYTMDPSYKGAFSANQFGVMFNTTFN